MSVVIRLSSQGAKKKRQFLIVATENRRQRDGGYLQKLGQYFPQKEKAEDKVKVDREAVDLWLSRGAKMTQTVGQLLRTKAN